MLRKGGEEGIQITLRNKSKEGTLKTGGGQDFFFNLIKTLSSFVLSREDGFSAELYSEETAAQSETRLLPTPAY